MSKSSAELRQSGQFPSTKWSRIVAASLQDKQQSREALAELCRAYWQPIYAFIRKKGNSLEAALDLTQDFFCRLLDKEVLAEADPTRGRFRSFLRAVCSAFLSNQRDYREAKKRGGGRPLLAIDADDAERRFARELSHDLTAERAFDRVWALTLLQRCFENLRVEYENAGRGAVFRELSVILTADPNVPGYAVIASRLGTNENAVRVAAHRLRQRYGFLLRQEIAATIDNPADVNDEIRSLFSALEGG